VSLIDLGPDAGHAWASPVYGGGVHPNAAGQAYVAPMILEGVLKQLPRRER
jgi:lysophospholipase L1-like esterase